MPSSSLGTSICKESCIVCTAPDLPQMRRHSWETALSHHGWDRLALRHPIAPIRFLYTLPQEICRRRLSPLTYAYHSRKPPSRRSRKDISTPMSTVLSDNPLLITITPVHPGPQHDPSKVDCPLVLLWLPPGAETPVYDHTSTQAAPC